MNSLRVGKLGSKNPLEPVLLQTDANIKRTVAPAHTLIVHYFVYLDQILIEMMLTVHQLRSNGATILQDLQLTLVSPS